MYKRFWFDVFRNVADPDISVSILEVSPLLCIVAAKVVIGVTVTALERWLHSTIESN
jgi:hypothetical protein